MHCGADAVRLVPRRYFWYPMFVPPLMRMIMTKRMTVQVPACPRHATSRFWNGPGLWGECRPIHMTRDEVTLTNVSPDFVAALDDYRDGAGPQWDEETRRQAKRRPRPAPSSGGRGAGTAVGVVFLVLGLLVVVPMLLCGGVVVVLLVARMAAGPMIPPGAMGPGQPAPSSV